MHKPISYHKEKINQKVRRGELTLGEEIVASEYSRYKVDVDSNSIIEEKGNVCARKIPFLQIRKKLLQKHEELSIIRNQPDAYYDYAIPLTLMK